MTDQQIVQTYYDGDPQREWERIAGKPEFLLTCRFLDRYLKPGQRVLDIGGGPGRYSLYLAKRGCDVTLVDLSGGNVAFALERAKEQGLPITALQADACRVAELGLDSFDHVLLMGPLYHLLEAEKRDQAVRAALSLLKPGGTFFAAFILNFSGFIYMMKFCPEVILSEDPTEAMFRTATAAQSSFGGDGFTRAFFIDPNEIRPFMAKFPLEELHLFGQEGVLSPCWDNLSKASPEAQRAWLDCAETFCQQPRYLSWAEHAMYVGRKTNE